MSYETETAHALERIKGLELRADVLKLEIALLELVVDGATMEEIWLAVERILENSHDLTGTLPSTRMIEPK